MINQYRLTEIGLAAREKGIQCISQAVDWPQKTSDTQGQGRHGRAVEVRLDLRSALGDI